MAVESAVYLSDLDVTNPTADAPVAEGAQHLRLIKSVLKGTFPNVNGAVTATDEQLNAVIGLPDRVTAAEGNRLRNDQNGTLTGSLNVTGTISQGGAPLVPVGTIVAWYGLLTAIPGGWRLCDGTNGTPDLRDRFVIGAGGTLSPGATIGTNSLSFSTASSGSHSHGGATAAAGAHSHSGVTSGEGSHSHSGSTAATALTVDQLPAHGHALALNAFSGNSALANNSPGWGGDNVGAGPFTTTTQNTGSGAGHAHVIGADGFHSHTVATAAAPDHQHALAADGSHTHAATIDNRPASMALAYLMKV